MAAALTLAALLALGVHAAPMPHYAQAGGGTRYTAADTRAEMPLHSARVRCVVTVEAGGGGNGFAPFDPNVWSSAGVYGRQLGILQMLEGDAVYRDFYSITPEQAVVIGWESDELTPDWRNPRQNMRYLEYLLAH